MTCAKYTACLERGAPGPQHTLVETEHRAVPMQTSIEMDIPLKSLAILIKITKVTLKSLTDF